MQGYHLLLLQYEQNIANIDILHPHKSSSKSQQVGDISNKFHCSSMRHDRHGQSGSKVPVLPERLPIA